MPDEPAAPAQTGQGVPPGTTVPYERMQEVSRQNQSYREENQGYKQHIETTTQEIAALKEQLATLAGPKPDQDRDGFYADPYQRIKALEAKIEEKSKQSREDALQEWESRQTFQTLRSAPVYTEEMEQAMVKVIQRYPALKNLPTSAALPIAYELAHSQKQWGQWGEPGYNTRQVKERLARPSASGAPSPMMTPEEYKKLSVEEYSKDEAGYDGKIKAWYAANT